MNKLYSAIVLSVFIMESIFGITSPFGRPDRNVSSGQVRFTLADGGGTIYCIKAPCEQPAKYGTYSQSSNTATTPQGSYHDIIFQETRTLKNKKYVFLGTCETSGPCSPAQQMCVMQYKPTSWYVFGILDMQASQQDVDLATIVEEAPVDSSQIETPAQGSIGGNPATWSPVQFIPAQKFASEGMAGNYFPSSKIATIHNPENAENSASYSFIQVQTKKPKRGKQAKRFVLIGTLEDGSLLYGMLQ